MRIIAGSLGGRLFESPHSHRTHPMSDKMRGALFNILGDLSGLSILDAFAGTGALAFEAISRGAQKAVAIEIDRPAQRAIASNISSLGLEHQVELIRANASSWLETSQPQLFDIVLCDPPYNDLQTSLLNRLSMRVQPAGLFILSYPAHQRAPNLAGFETIQQHTYGDAQLAFYRKLP